MTPTFESNVIVSIQFNPTTENTSKSCSKSNSAYIKVNFVNVFYMRNYI